VSSKARAKIKEFLREDKKRHTVQGKEMVERKLRQLKLDLSNVVSNQLRAYFNCKTSADFFYKVGKGFIDVHELNKFKNIRLEKSNGKHAEISDAKTFESQIKKVRSAESDMLLIGEDMDKIDYILAKCCNPIPGDDVFGFVTVNEGIKIHRTSCPNAVELMSNYGYRIIKAKWTSQKEIAFLAGLRVTGTDRVGLVNDVTKIISNELKVNMRSITLDTNDGIFEGNIMLFVHDTKHLEMLVKKLSKVPGIVNITRFDS
jgi:GTP pyrophosphokinase